MHFHRPLLRKSSWNWIVLVATLTIVAPRMVHAEALLVVEADTGKVLEAQNATYPWYPASVTKMMTAYVTLKAVKEGRISLDTLLTVSPVAASQSPSKMGFRPGTQVTVDNALKMMLVKSANEAGGRDNVTAIVSRLSLTVGAPGVSAIRAWSRSGNGGSASFSLGYPGAAVPGIREKDERRSPVCACDTA